GRAPVGEMIRAGLQNQPAVLERVMHSPTLAPFLPAEIQMPPKNITPDEILAVGMAGPHSEWKWQSREFGLGMSAMIIFVRGQAQETRFAVVDRASGTKYDFRPSGRQLGDWKEWLVHVTPGLYRLDVEAGAATDDFAFILPRPLSVIGYWV